MNVKLLTRTPSALFVLFTAARGCYSPSPVAEIWDNYDGYTPEKMLGVVRGCIKRNHNSVMRHVNFTFAIDGISRACANQLTRHAAGWAFDQQSLRYVKLDTEPGWVIPDGLPFGQHQAIYNGAADAFAAYRAAIDAGAKAEDARSALPLCTPTNLTATANLAALLHLWRVRYLNQTGKAQDEIQQLTKRMVESVIAAEPWLGEFFQEASDG